ncbi:Electroneutral sodium bicarbonate exchanger 1 [Cichlidogyrus casuarinus]|uniref:Electroneutral sodium bicarbonate exchanger 1 n=1 Tax=Cichlidogyrus casuarinus TaxID=1844966 RepID=A0ABD2PIM2_9PLAT
MKLLFNRQVKLSRVHLFTAIQVVSFSLLWMVKTIDVISIMFPLMVLALCFVRKLLDFLFTQHDLEWLDDLLPTSKLDKKDKRKAHYDKEEPDLLEMENSNPPL